MGSKSEISGTTSSLSTECRLRFVANVIDLDTKETHLSAQFMAISDKLQTAYVSREFIGEWAKIGRQLLKVGADFPVQGLGEIVKSAYQVFEQQEIKTTLLRTRKCGFVGEDFVLVDKTTGPRKSTLSFFESTSGSELQTSGSWLDWKKGLRKPCKSSSYLTFYLATSFAGPILSLIGDDEGAVFHSVGESSSGKSLGIRAGASVIGRASKNDLCTFDMTDTALDEACYAANDLTIFLDEFSRLEGNAQKKREKATNIAFRVPSGRGRVRSKSVKSKSKDYLADLTWRTLGLSSAEVSLSEGAKDIVKGEKVRLIEVPVPNISTRNGIFDRLVGNKLEKRKQSEQLVTRIEKTIGNNYGVAIRFFLQSLSAGEMRL